MSTNSEELKIYRVRVTYSVSRDFWAKAASPEDAEDWAMETMSGWENFSLGIAEVEVDASHSSVEEAEAAQQFIFDAYDEW